MKNKYYMHYDKLQTFFEHNKVWNIPVVKIKWLGLDRFLVVTKKPIKERELYAIGIKKKVSLWRRLRTLWKENNRYEPIL